MFLGCQKHTGVGHRQTCHTLTYLRVLEWAVSPRTNPKAIGRAISLRPGTGAGVGSILRQEFTCLSTLAGCSRLWAWVWVGLQSPKLSCKFPLGQIKPHS